MDDSAGVSALLILARALYLGSGLVLVNAAVFARLLLEPIPARGSTAGWLEAIQRRMRATFWIAAGLLVVASVLWFWAVAAEMSGSSVGEALDGGTWSLVLRQTRFGVVGQVRIGLFLVLALVGGSLRFKFSRPAEGVLQVVTGLVAAALLASVAWTGHAGSAGGAAYPWTLIADTAHLLAGAIWPAGLLGFAWILSSGLNDGQPSTLVVVSGMARRFSALSLGAVIVLALSGGVDAWFLVHSIGAFVTTWYGRVLSLKLVFFTAMLGLAAWNRLRLLPCLYEEERAGSLPGMTQVIEQLRRSVRLELGLAAGIIAIVALLGMLPPPR